MFRRLALGLLATGLLSRGSGLRAAAHDRNHAREGARRDLRRLHTDRPCAEEGPLYTITTTSNLVMHETIFDDGRVHATFTQTGTFSAVPLEVRACRATRVASRSGELQPERDDGERHVHLQSAWHGLGRVDADLHNLDHFNVRPDGSVNEFFRCH